MHQAITKYFKKYHLFGFTGTPIFAANAGVSKNPTLRTTEQAFGDQLHTYTIVDAINDKNVLPFKVDYVCNGYHRHTHMVCSSHRINESVLDEQIYKQLAVMRDGLSKCSRQIESDIRSWMSQKNNVSKRIKRLQVEQILMEKIKDRDNAERYERMIEKRNREIEGFKNEITKIENIDKTIEERKKAMLENANLLDKILSEKELSHTNLCLLIEKIIIYEDEYGLRLEMLMKAPFLEKSYTDEIGMICEDNCEEVSA